MSSAQVRATQQHVQRPTCSGARKARWEHRRGARIIIRSAARDRLRLRPSLILATRTATAPRRSECSGHNREDESGVSGREHDAGERRSSHDARVLDRAERRVDACELGGTVRERGQESVLRGARERDRRRGDRGERVYDSGRRAERECSSVAAIATDCAITRSGD